MILGHKHDDDDDDGKRMPVKDAVVARAALPPALRPMPV